MTQKEFRWRLLKQSLFQKRAKAIIILLAVTMGSSVVAALLNLQIDLRSRMNRELRDYGPNVVLQPENSGAYIAPAFLKSLQAAPVSQNIIAYTPQLFVSVQIQRRPVLLSVVDLQSYRKLYPSQDWKVRSGADESKGLFLGKRLAERIRAQEQQEMKIEIAGREILLPLAGSVETGEAEDDQAFISAELAGTLGLTNNGFHSVLLSVLGDLPDVEREFNALVANNTGVQYQLIRKIASAESTILDKISRLMGLVVLLIFVILFFCIHTTVSAILLSRQSEIALLRVLGARRKQITAVFITELLLLGLVGGFAGYIVGMMMAQVLGRVLFQSFITPNAVVFLITIFFSLFLMVVSSFFPISRAVNRQAAVVLKET